MPSKPQAEFAFHALAAALPETGAEPPEWITIFAKAGQNATRDGRSYDVDPRALISRFNSDGVDLPVDVNHATHHAALTGSRADAIGWIKELRIGDNGALEARVDWLDEGKALLAARKYRFVSPDFFHTADKRPTWLRSVALVTAPALGKQKALAAASAQEQLMKDLAAALGLSADASEAAMLAALQNGFVAKTDSAFASKAIHDEAIAKLTAANAELTTIKEAARKAQIDALLDGAVKEKKILPAQKEHYAGLCATDAGLTSVKALLAATTPVLPGSGLDNKKAPEGGGDERPAPALLAAEAHKLVEEGKAPDFITAVGIVDAKYATAAA